MPDIWNYFSVNDTLESVFDESGDEEEQDAIVSQVLDEIGIEITGKASCLIIFYSFTLSILHNKQTMLSLDGAASFSGGGDCLPFLDVNSSFLKHGSCGRVFKILTFEDLVVAGKPLCIEPTCRLLCLKASNNKSLLHKLLYIMLLQLELLSHTVNSTCHGHKKIFSDNRTIRK